MQNLPYESHVWRRLLAYMIDYVIFQLTIGMVIFVVMAFALPETTMFERAGDPDRNLTEAQQQILADRYGTDWQSRKLAMTITASAALRKPVSVLFVADLDQPGTVAKFPAVLIDRGDGRFVPLDARDYLPYLLAGMVLMPLCFGIFNGAGRRSPGKKTAGLVILRVRGGPPGMATAIIREILKFLVPSGLAAYALADGADTVNRMLASPLGPGFEAATQADFIRFVWVAAGCWFLSVLYWVLPFIFWRGQTSYDWLTGLAVYDARSPAIPEPQSPA